MSWSQSYLILIISLVSTIKGKKCYFSCGEFDNCNIDTRCGGKCAAESENASNPISYSVSECTTDEDFCIYREMEVNIFKGNSGNLDRTVTVAIPGGCLLEY